MLIPVHYASIRKQSSEASTLFYFATQGSDKIHRITCIRCTNECGIWRCHIIPWLLAATRKRIVILQWKGYFLDKKEVLRCLYKVFSILCQVRKDVHHLRFIRSARMSKANSWIVSHHSNWLRNDDNDSLVNWRQSWLNSVLISGCGLINNLKVRKSQHFCDVIQWFINLWVIL